MLVRATGQHKAGQTLFVLLLLLLPSLAMAFLLPGAGTKTIRRSLASWLKRAAAAAPLPGRWASPSTCHPRAAMALHSSSQNNHVHNPLFDDVPDRGYVSPSHPIPSHLTRPDPPTRPPSCPQPHLQPEMDQVRAGHPPLVGGGHGLPGPAVRD